MTADGELGKRQFDDNQINHLRFVIFTPIFEDQNRLFSLYDFNNLNNFLPQNRLPTIGILNGVDICCANVMPKRPDALPGVIMIGDIKITRRSTARKNESNTCTVQRRTLLCSAGDSIAPLLKLVLIKHLRQDNILLQTLC